MATLSKAESRRLYSWWWDSHISPKNSKWLQENLSDMDVKIKSMIKLIEEDADSFRKRAEMYYRKRPELMKLVEEFYRAYRALAERYDHATGALRQAHRTMAEAFPDQVLMMLPDESPSGSSMATDAEPHTPNFLRGHGLFDPNDHTNGLFPDEIEDILIKPRDEEGSKKLVNGRARKGLSFEKIEGKVSLEEEERRNLKHEIARESERASKAETEVDNLKNTVSRMESEKDAVFIQNKLSEEKISSLETDIARKQEEFRKRNDEMLIGISKLKIAEDRCQCLEEKNRSLQAEMDFFKDRAKELQGELEMKQGALEKLNLSVKDEHQRFVQADTARESLKELHSQSEEKVKLLAAEIQTWAEKLELAETNKASLEEEIQRLKEEIARLNEQSNFNFLKIINLQHEINLLEESKRKLEDEVKKLAGEKRYLQEDKKDLEQRHNALTEQIGAVHVNVESLQSLVKELRDGNIEMKDLCKKHEAERILQFENFKYFEKVTEENSVLQNSLSKANAELEDLREKVRASEESCEALNTKILASKSEKAVLVAQVEAIARNMEKLSEENALLENSLSDVNVELEGLRGMLNASERLCESLRAQISDLVAEKSALVNKVESIGHSMQNLESKFTELQDNNSSLEGEKDHALDQVKQLRLSLQLEKEECEALMQSSRVQLATLEKQISLLRENSYTKEEELEIEHNKLLQAQTEIFILKRCLLDLRERYVSISDRCQSKEELISKLEQEISTQRERLTLLSEYNEKLVEGIYQVMRVLNVSDQCQFADDRYFGLILLKIEELKTSILDVRDDSHRLILEKSVILSFLELESERRSQELSVLQSERQHLLELNEVLKAERDILRQQLSDLLEAHFTSLNEISKLTDINESFFKKISHLSEENYTLKEENGELFAEAMKLEHLYCLFRSYSDERALDLQLLNDANYNLFEINSSFGQEIKILNEKLGAMEFETVSLKELLVVLEDEVKTTRSTCEQLSVQIEEGKDLVAQKDMELLAANRKLHSLMMDLDEAKEKNMSFLELDANRNNEIVNLHRANDALTCQLERLLEEVEELKNRERCLTEEVSSCEVEIEALLDDFQIATVNSAISKEKMFELVTKCESLEASAIEEKEIARDEISKRDAFEDYLRGELDAMNGESRSLKEELSAFLPLVLSVRDCVNSLEGNILSLAEHHSLSNQEEQGNYDHSLQQRKRNEEEDEDHIAKPPSGILEMQKLHAKVIALGMTTRNIQAKLEEGSFVQAAKTKGEEPESKGTAAHLEELPIGKDSILHLKKKDETDIVIKPDAEIFEKYEQIMKDIQLDHVLKSAQYENGSSSRAPSATGSDEIRDQMMELWEAVSNNNKLKPSPMSSEYEIECHPIETVEEEQKSVYKDTELHHERTASISERLATDAERLSLLQKSVKELNRIMENSELNRTPTSFEFKKVKSQLEDAEGAILQMIDANRKLAKKAEKISPASSDDIEDASERKLSDRARRRSDKIGRLELELQKLEYMWLKLKEEHDYKMARAANRRARVLLRDYLYGRRETTPRRKKVHCCACIRPRTKDD